MIKATVAEVRTAYVALRAMNQEIRLPQKPAWRISRLLGKMKLIVTEFEETQLKLYRDAGGVETGNGVQLTLDDRRQEESGEEFAARRKVFQADLQTLNDQMRALGKEEVEVDYDPLPLTLFDDAPNTVEDKKMKFNPNFFEDAGQFIKE